MTAAYLQALMLIFIAEMGDKSQILAMAFATKYKLKYVVVGILIGTVLNHGLAVLLGVALANVVPLEFLQIIAGVAFLGFAFWSLSLDDEEDETSKRSYGPVITIALAFFIGELGDKTQLTTIVLASESLYPAVVFVGTVSGMLITSAIGIYVGSKLGKNIPEFFIKVISAVVFYIVGVLKLWGNIPKDWLQPTTISVFFIVSALIAFAVVKPTIVKRRSGDVAMKRRAQDLKEFYSKFTKDLEDLCLGPDICGDCERESCIVGATKILVQHGETNKPFDVVSLKKNFDPLKAVRSLETILNFLDKNDGDAEIFTLKNNLEFILFNQKVYYHNREDYMKKIKEMDNEIYSLFQGYEL